MPSREALDDFLARRKARRGLRGCFDRRRRGAGQGPFRSSLDVGASGLIEAHGIACVSVAGIPKAIPICSRPAPSRCSKPGATGTADRIHVDVITQFCFESAPILAWLGELDARGLDLAVMRSGRPGNAATLTKFALRCGVGNSIRSLRSQIGRFGGC